MTAHDSKLTTHDRATVRYVTSEEMRDLEREAGEKYALSPLILMENAGRSVAEFIEKAYGPAPKRALVVCGQGNNGGDGFAVARHLRNRGFEVEIALYGEPSAFKPETAGNFDTARRMGLPIDVHPSFESFEERMSWADLLVDALFGTGLKRNLGSPHSDVVRLMNGSGRKIVSIDLPSGLDADSGDVRGAAVKAAYTVSLGYSKVGLIRNSGPAYSGLIVWGDISLPAEKQEAPPDAAPKAPRSPRRRRRPRRRPPQAPGKVV